MKIFFATDPHVTAQPPSSRIDDFLESICNKFSWIRSQMSEDDWLLLGGDVFNRFHVSDGAVNALLRVLPRNVASIFGNHDFNRRAVEGFEENSLSVLFNSGRILPLAAHPLLVGGFQVVGFDFNQPINEFDVTNKIVVTHLAVSKEPGLFPPAEVWSHEDIERQKPKVILTGHDHVTYPVERVGKTVVLRPGALSRGTRHGFQKVRDIYVAVIDFSNGSMEYLSVPCLPADEVFAEESLMFVKAQNDLKKFIEYLKGSKSIEGEAIYDVIQQMALPVSVRDRLMKYLADGGIIIQEKLVL